MTAGLMSKNRITVVQPSQEDPTVAKRGQSYPIRLLHTVNGILIVGLVVHVTSDTIHVLRPYCVEVNYNEKKHEVTCYNILPYLDQLVDYDPTSKLSTPFVISSIISMSTPAPHLLRNYMTMVGFKEHISEYTADAPLYSGEYTDGNSIH